MSRVNHNYFGRFELSLAQPSQERLKFRNMGVAFAVVSGVRVDELGVELY